MTLAERVVALHRALEAAEVPHAFGGAIALAFATLNPRGTVDIDCNLFVPAEDPSPAIAALPDGIKRPRGLAARIARDGQVRLWWDDTPVDLFFDYAPIHEQAARNVRRVEFDGVELPVLGPVELVVFKVMFDRTQDWADVEAAVEAGAVDMDAVRTALAALLDPDDPRLERLAEVERRLG
ncbi:MAG TPA: hypothetical protein VJT75_11140 [Thermoleophilaceae bacterium]|nr:hypothetical protein [Thermoleophilaceae bacterium]